MKFSKIVRKVISLSKAAIRTRMESTDEDQPMVTWEDYTSPTKPAVLEERRLREFLEAQPAEVIYMLTALMHLGGGDFGPKDLLDQYTEISETFGGPKNAAAHMFTSMLLSEDLENALRVLDESGIDVDGLVPAPKI